MTCNQFGNCDSSYNSGTLAAAQVATIPFPPRAVIPSDVREEIRREAAQLTDRGIGDLIASTLVRRGVDWRHVALDEMKQLVVAATLASQQPASQ